MSSLNLLRQMPNVQTANRAPGSESVQGQKAQTQNRLQKNHKNLSKYSETLNVQIVNTTPGPQSVVCCPEGTKHKTPRPQKHPEKSANMYKTHQVFDVYFPLPQNRPFRKFRTSPPSSSLKVPFPEKNSYFVHSHAYKLKWLK